MQPTLEQLLPHRGDMLWLDGFDWQRQQPWALVKSEFLLADALGWPNWVGVELMAQGIACAAGVRLWHQGRRAEPGMLVQVKSYQTAHSHFTYGTSLWVDLQLQQQLGALASYHVRLLDQTDQAVATAVISVIEELA